MRARAAYRKERDPTEEMGSRMPCDWTPRKAILPRAGCLPAPIAVSPPPDTQTDSSPGRPARCEWRTLVRRLKRPPNARGPWHDRAVHWIFSRDQPAAIRIEATPTQSFGSQGVRPEPSEEPSGIRFVLPLAARRCSSAYQSDYGQKSFAEIFDRCLQPFLERYGWFPAKRAGSESIVEHTAALLSGLRRRM
jgi:hypothetical protein